MPRRRGRPPISPPERELPEFVKVPSWLLLLPLSANALKLWLVLRAHAWRDEERGRFSPPAIALLDKELQQWMGMTRQQINNLIRELEGKGLLVRYREGGRRYLRLVKPEGINVKPILRKMDFTENPYHHDLYRDRSNEESYVVSLTVDDDLSPKKHGANSRQMDFTENPLDINSPPSPQEAFLAFLTERGVFEAPARRIVEALMVERGLTLDEAKAVFLETLRETEDIRLTVARLKGGHLREDAEAALDEALWGGGASAEEADTDDLPPVSPPPRSKPRLRIDPEAESLWREVLDELQLQLARATFDTWLRPTQGLALRANGDGRHHLLVLAPNGYAVEWLSGRLYPRIAETVGRLWSGEGDPPSVKIITQEILPDDLVEEAQKT